ncbi:MAG: hypothetical protein ABIQ12_03590 [Opitutaceae bacterium]
MIRTLRAYFLSRLLREKLLLIGLLAIGMLWWLSAFGSRAGQFWRTQRGTTATMEEQQLWLKNQPAIETRVQQSTSQFDAGKTLDRIKLVEALNQAAFEAGLRDNYGSNSAKSDTSDQVTLHSVDFLIRQADYSMLQRFYLNVQKRAPYIGIESFALQPNQADPNKVTLSLRASAVETIR